VLVLQCPSCLAAWAASAEQAAVVASVAAVAQAGAAGAKSNVEACIAHNTGTSFAHQAGVKGGR
jgi:hypothetical protein